MDAQELAAFLAGSPDRSRLLAHLRRGPSAPRDVADALGVATRSAQRNLGEFVDRGLAERRPGGYALTTVGELVADRHAAYLDDLGVVAEFETLFRHLPDADHTPDPAWLREADIVVATPAYPQAPVDHYVETLASLSTTRIRMLSPVLSRQFHTVHAKKILAGVETELILSTETAETARSLNPVEFAFVLRVDRFDLYRCPDEFGIGLTLGDEWLLLNAYDDDGQLQACAYVTDAACLDWADTLYDRYRSRSERVEPSGRWPFGSR